MGVINGRLVIRRLAGDGLVPSAARRQGPDRTAHLGPWHARHAAPPLYASVDSNNNENTCRIESIGWGHRCDKEPPGTFQSSNLRIMVQPPNMDDLNLSDSDTDALFDTPAARKNKQRAQEPGADAGEGAAPGKARGKESHYTTEEAREAALRQELESVRNVNKVIEGVVESLQKAKDN